MPSEPLNPRVKISKGGRAYVETKDLVESALGRSVTPAAPSEGEIPWAAIHEVAKTDILSIVMDSVNGRLTTSGLMEAIAEYATCAFRLGRAPSVNQDAEPEETKDVE